MNKQKYPIKKEIDIIKRITYDTSLHPTNEWTILWEDRFSGIIETNFDDFYKLDIVPSLHRIRMFKRNGTIFWNRYCRFDKINY